MISVLLVLGVRVGWQIGMDSAQRYIVISLWLNLVLLLMLHFPFLHYSSYSLVVFTCLSHLSLVGNSLSKTPTSSKASLVHRTDTLGVSVTGCFIHLFWTSFLFSRTFGSYDHFISLSLSSIIMIILPSPISFPVTFLYILGLRMKHQTSS